MRGNHRDDNLHCDWTVKEITRENEFLKWLIEHVPDGSIWEMRDLTSLHIYKTLKKFIVNGNKTILPRKQFEVILDKVSKKEILSKIDEGFDFDIIHQCIYYQDTIYFISYDNLGEGSTRLSHKIQKEELDKLAEKGIAIFK